MVSKETAEAALTNNLKEEMIKAQERRYAESANKEPRNLQASYTDMLKDKEGGKRVLIKHTLDNRAARRQKEYTKPVNNNRSKTKARKGNRLFIKMSKFYMAITDKKIKAGHNHS